MACSRVRIDLLRNIRHQRANKQKNRQTVARTSKTETSSPSSLVSAPLGESKAPAFSATSFRKLGCAVRAPSSDLITGPVLCDSDYGEHASAFLSGNFQPVIHETSAVVEIRHGGRGQSSYVYTDERPFEFIGALPNDFPGGKFIYVGPNPKFSQKHYKVWGSGPGQDKVKGRHSSGWHHWFEGDGMVYAVDFGFVLMIRRLKIMAASTCRMASPRPIESQLRGNSPTETDMSVQTAGTTSFVVARGFSGL